MAQRPALDKSVTARRNSVAFCVKEAAGLPDILAVRDRTTVTPASGTPGTWNGTQCCLDQPAACAKSLPEDDCRTNTPANEVWTGSKCCVNTNVTCTGGTAETCKLFTTAHWWDGQCCVNGEQTCVDGVFSYCNGANGTPTGTKCCLPGKWTCDAPRVNDSCPTGYTKSTGKYCCKQ
jgi:hypothetical protein